MSSSKEHWRELDNPRTDARVPSSSGQEISVAWQQRQNQHGKIKNHVSISERPEVADEKNEVGRL
jgi:hypothetical protein